MVTDGESATETGQVGYSAVVGTIKGDGPLIDDGAKLGWGYGLGDVRFRAGGALAYGACLCPGDDLLGFWCWCG